MRNDRPGDLVALAVIGGAIAYHFDTPGWAILVGALAVGWVLNEEARRERERGLK